MRNVFEWTPSEFGVTIRSGKFHAGSDFQCGENVVIDVAEEVVVGDRCVLGDNTYISGRRVTIGSDFYGYSHWGKRLEIGLGRRDDEFATLQVGDRCTFHDNRIDLAAPVIVHEDVGLSPEVAIYTHYYWQNPYEGFPFKYGGVVIQQGVFVGFRSTILPESVIGAYAVIGAGSVVAGVVPSMMVCYGNPLQIQRRVEPTMVGQECHSFLYVLVREYQRTLDYRGIAPPVLYSLFPEVRVGETKFDVVRRTVEGPENDLTDDFRDFMFKRGVRFYTKRPFRKLPRRQG